MSKVTFAVEEWDSVWREMEPMWHAHWLEVALDHESIPLDPDIDAYSQLQSKGMLHIVVARSDGVVVGYHISILRTHLHYRTSLHAFVDLYYIAPSHRKGMTGVRLIKEAVASLGNRGVKKIVSGTKVSLDMSPIFRRLGWAETERTYTYCFNGSAGVKNG